MTTLFTTVKSELSEVWNFFFEHKDDLDSVPGGDDIKESLLSHVGSILGSVPAAAWFAVITVLLGILAIRLYAASKTIETQVKTGVIK